MVPTVQDLQYTLDPELEVAAVSQPSCPLSADITGIAVGEGNNEAVIQLSDSAGYGSYDRNALGVV